MGRNRRTPQDDTARSFALIAGTVAVVGALLATVGFAVVSFDPLGSLPNNGKSAVAKTIRIPATACPFLHVVNVAAKAAGYHWIDALGYDTPETWRPFAKQLDPKLTMLENSLRAAIVHVPLPVASKLRGSLHQVVIGRRPLFSSLTAKDYLRETNDAVVNGYSDLSDASDLVGNQCGFTLAPALSIS